MKSILLFIILFMMGIGSIQAQVVIQLERYGNPKVEKYFEGSVISFKSRSFPNDWQTERILEIKDKEKMLVFENGYIELADIIAIRKYNPIMNVVSKGLYTFGASWYFFGAIATLKDKYDAGWDTVAIGGFAFLGGWVFNKFKYKKTTINKRNRLRILDISWPDPEPILIP